MAATLPKVLSVPLSMLNAKPKPWRSSSVDRKDGGCLRAAKDGKMSRCPKKYHAVCTAQLARFTSFRTTPRLSVARVIKATRRVVTGIIRATLVLPMKRQPANNGLPS
jgi:hypothetical protein